jgi:hypothetical protein
MPSIYTVDPERFDWGTYTVEIGGVRFFKSQDIGAVTDGSVDHSVVTEMINRGAPMFLMKPAHDMDGQAMFDSSEVFVDVGLQHEIFDEFERLKNEGDWAGYEPPPYHPPPPEHDT